MADLRLLSHELCPYVQRAVILLSEKNISFQKDYIDLKQKPEWFLQISPLGKVPVLKIDEQVLFESSVICEYLDETYGVPLHPRDTLMKAKHRSWMEFTSTLLMLIWRLCGEPEAAGFATVQQELVDKLGLLEAELQAGPYFTGPDFSLVDIFFAPVFRYVDVFDQYGYQVRAFDGRPKLKAWSQFLGERTSVKAAVPEDYGRKLFAAIKERDGYLSRVLND